MAMKEQSRKFISNSTESIRMFKASWMEALSKVHFSVPLIIYLPVIGWLLWQWPGNWLTLMGLFLLGLFAWTFAEYVLHRFVFHWIPPGRWGERLHFIWHGVHHDYPNDRLRLVMPPSVSIPLAFLFFFGFQALLGRPVVFPFFAGFVAGYLCYDTMHYAIHHLRWNHPLWQRIKHHHMLHHYQENDRGFGVSNPLWDYVFRTTFNLTRKK
ncbi:MAG: sterol desaturase family protein [Saprospiraceae bacterium]|nr:sterol desaturase family protein [Saprospiraceae bacterium]